MVGCMFMDVTDRVTAEQALAESERRRREILGSMLQAEEVERSRIATELHDDTVQVMAAALLALDRVSLVARGAARTIWRRRSPWHARRSRRPPSAPAG